MLIRTHNLLRYILKTLLPFLLSTFSHHLVITLLTRWLSRHIIHFIYHLYSSTWSLTFIVTVHQNILRSESCDAVICWNCDFVFIYVVLDFWLFLTVVHHATRSNHWLLFLIRVSFVALILIHFHSHCYALSLWLVVVFIKV